MPRLNLESSNDSFNLDSVLTTGMGVQVLAGVTGLGLPPVAGQWLEGAGDGAIFRGRRALARDIDLPLLIQDQDRNSLKALLARLSIMLAGPCTLRLVEDDGTDYSTVVHRVGGGSYVYGPDSTGTKDMLMVITVRAGDPFWTSSVTQRAMVGEGIAPAGLLGPGGLVSLQVASSQAIGSIVLTNDGSASAYPVWEVLGPGRDFKAISAKGETLHVQCVLAAGQKRVIDTKAGTVVDELGANRYGELAAAPRFWAIPPGTTTAVASLEDTTPGTSRLVVSWRPRMWMVV